MNIGAKNRRLVTGQLNGYSQAFRLIRQINCLTSLLQLRLWRVDPFRKYMEELVTKWVLVMVI